MMKKLAFVTALLSLALLGGCAKGGSGPCAVNCPAIVVEPDVISKVGLNVSVPLTLTFKNTPMTPVNWAIQPSSCGSACGTLTNVTTSTATYVGPSSVPSNPDFTIVASSQTGGLSGSLPLTIIPVTTNVGPVSANVGIGLTQQYGAAAEPGQAPQTFTWSCLANGFPCANFSQDPNVSSLAYYRPTAGEECSSSGCVTISASATIDPTGCSVDSKNFPCPPSLTTAVSSRVPAGIYAFQFSGYDKNGKAIVLAGTFTVASGGAISGFEDETAWNGSKFTTTARAFSGGSYTPINGGNPISNNSGTLDLNTGAFPSTYGVVLSAAGDVQMIASDGAGDSGSGIAEPSATNKFNKGSSATFAFGFAGIDAGNNRVGYVGLLPTDGVSAVTGGLIDVNDNGSASNSVCAASSGPLATPPCPVAGSYVADGTVSNLWHMTLTSPIAMTFDFFVANGSENSNGNNPLNLYAISTDSNPPVVGTMTYQNPKITTYNNAAFSGVSVSALTGANGNVALILTTTLGDDMSSGVSGACQAMGSGNLEGNFDQNNPSLGSNNIISVSSFPSVAQSPNPYTYVSTSGTGRYLFCMLGNPGASPIVLPIPFVMYASGANRGFLLDQSSSAVMTGTMNAQAASAFFSNPAAVGTYSVATNTNSAATCSLLPACYATMNLVVAAPTVVVPMQPVLASNVTGTENPTNVSVSYIFNMGVSGYGTIGPLAPATTPPNYVIYGVTGTDFFMIDVDAGVSSPILYMAQ